MKSFPLLCAGFAVALAATGSLAADHQETRNVSGFTELALHAPVNVDVVQGGSEGLVLEGDPEYIARIETVVENGTLKIRYTSRDRVWNMAKIRAHVRMKTIEGLAIAGAGDITAQSVQAKELRVSISGSGDIRLGALAADHLSASISGSGNLFVAGKVDRAETSIAGSGDLKAAKLESREAHVSIAGSGDAIVWARELMSVSIVGAGDVRYYGDPTVKKSVIGSGSVKRLAANP
ncbi:MAG TPA: head GIN domain-containing protein [Usitatibacter sp.]|jgi:hypothetical protein|nr:head GIN domain-containing protein [Usitatibacter sp.]